MAWTQDELLGACKAEWNATGLVGSWDVYTPEVVDAAVEPYPVVFRGADGTPDLRCEVSGTPSEPQVVTASG